MANNVPKGSIWSIEKSAWGAWIIRGVIGMRQYVGYPKREAIGRYRRECLNQRGIFTNTPAKKGA